MELENKNIIVTGAVAGIGEALVKELLKYKVKIFAVDKILQFKFIKWRKRVR